MKPVLLSEDVLVLLKLAVLKTHSWELEFLAEEIGHSQTEVLSSLERLRLSGFIDKSSDKINHVNLKEFLLFGIQYLFPTRPGKIVRGMGTGAKSNLFFAAGLPYSSIWVWPKPDGLEQGYEITPLSPHCCFAALNDSRLKHLLAVTETMRVAGREARSWAMQELNKIFG